MNPFAGPVGRTNLPGWYCFFHYVVHRNSVELSNESELTTSILSDISSDTIYKYLKLSFFDRSAMFQLFRLVYPLLYESPYICFNGARPRRHAIKTIYTILFYFSFE